MPRKTREDPAEAWPHRTLRTPGLAKCVKLHLVKFV